MNGFWEISKNPIFELLPGLFLGTLEHEFLVYGIICVKTGRYTYLTYYLTHFDEKWAKSVKGSWDIDEKVIFVRKMPPLWKIRIFGKWPLGLIYDPPWPLTSCKKSEKSNERILRNVQKTLFLDCHLVYFWTRQSMNTSFIA